MNLSCNARNRNWKNNTIPVPFVWQHHGKFQVENIHHATGSKYISRINVPFLPHTNAVSQPEEFKGKFSQFLKDLFYSALFAQAVS